MTLLDCTDKRSYTYQADGWSFESESELVEDVDKKADRVEALGRALIDAAASFRDVGKTVTFDVDSDFDSLEEIE